MPEYLSPGVYVEEIDAGPKPIEGVSTSTAGAVGVTAFGPDDGKPVLITSFADYVRVFGGAVEVDEVVKSKWSDDPQLGEFWTFPLAIKGFFDNGGQRIYVRRVVSKGAKAAKVTMGQGVIAVIVTDTAAGSTVLKLSSLIGISKGTQLTLVVGGVETAVTVSDYDSAAQTVTLTQPLAPATSVKAQRDFVVVATTAGPGSVAIEADSVGAWGKDLSIRAEPMDAGSFALLADPGIATNTAVTTSVAADVVSDDKFDVLSATGLVAGDRIYVDGKAFEITAVAGTKITVAQPAQAWTTGMSVIRVRLSAPANPAGNTLFVWGASSLYKNGLVEIEDLVARTRSYQLISSVAGNTVTLANPINFKLWEGQRIRLIEARFTARYKPKEGPEQVEVISNVRLKEAEPQDPMHISKRLGALSRFVELAAGATVDIGTLATFPLALSTAPVKPAQWMKLEDGSDDYGTLAPDAFVGVDGGPGKRTGIQALEDIDEISIVVAPSMWSSLIQNALIQQCEILKYRFAILDPRPVNPASLDAIGDIRAFREGFDTKYAALYFPRIQVRDPFAGRTIGLGPSGHMAGLYARVDVERGVHKAPANEVIRGIDIANGFHGLEDEITRREQDMLNPKGINALRFFPDRGTRVWGARTLSSDGSWKYINVRRIFIWVERSIDVGTQWVVFEPNDEKTWARVRQTITNFLTTVWRSGALFGTKAEEAFFVRCDRTTMTEDDINNGRLIVAIGIAPVKPAEFVIFRIQQKLIDQKEP
jgi:phage tail sheath protein FI